MTERRRLRADLLAEHRYEWVRLMDLIRFLSKFGIRADRDRLRACDGLTKGEHWRVGRPFTKSEEQFAASREGVLYHTYRVLQTFIDAGHDVTGPDTMFAQCDSVDPESGMTLEQIQELNHGDEFMEGCHA